MKRIRPCCVPGCKDKKSGRHIFPKNLIQRKVWLERIGNSALLENSGSALICDRHFEPDCFWVNGRLKRASYPTLELPNYVKAKQDLPRPPRVPRTLPMVTGVSNIPETGDLPNLVVRTPSKVYGKKRLTPEASHAGLSQINPEIVDITMAADQEPPDKRDLIAELGTAEKSPKLPGKTEEAEFMELEEPMEEGDEQELDNIYQLKEELKRLHESEDEEVERDEKPIMEDSDLQEMFSADEIVKDTALIEASQQDIRTTDVLVCGRCHEVYHFIEEFRSHKSQMCKEKSAIVPVCEGESKQIWGFTLWKNKFIGLLKPNDAVPMPWVIYQKWCKLAPVKKDIWISAGQELQYYSKVGAMKIIDESNKENLVDNSQMTVNTNDPVQDKPIDSVANTTKSQELDVEKIVAMRFNRKKKYWEYQIKWEPFSNENSWNLVTNQTHCMQMVKEFEAHLKGIDIEGTKQQQQATATSTPIVEEKTPVQSSTIDCTLSHSQRMNKRIISNDDAASSLKRKLDDSYDSFEQKVKLASCPGDSDNPKPPLCVGLTGSHTQQLIPKTAGSMKLDSETSQISTRRRRTMDHVAPKIAQISTVKKDGSSTSNLLQANTKQMGATHEPVTYKTIIKKVIHQPQIGRNELPRDSSQKGSDGQQQCLLVTQQEISQQSEDIAMLEGAASATETVSEENDQNDEVLAQLVKTEPLSPGGTRKVVLMLPDGNLMVTQVSPEEYADLGLE